MEGILTKIDDNLSDRWTVTLDGKETSIVKKHLSMGDSEKEKTVITAAKILGNCSNPHGLPKHKVGLAIGKVQSGKTSNYICLTALAFDNDYDIVIIFGGSSNVLLDQTYDRVCDNFDIESRVDERTLAILSTSNNFNDYSSDDLERIYRNGQKIIITALKSYTHIQKIIKMLKKANIYDKPTLIIDDEGDQMSLNGAVRKGKTTTTYREFVNLFTDLTFSTFVSVTATPQANLLIDKNDILSPDFCELIEPGKLYSGSDTFHKKPKTEYINIIPDNENVMLDEDSGIPESFEKAVSVFFVGGAIRKLRGDNSTHSMLIHPSSKTIDHNKVTEKLNNFLYLYGEYCKSNESDLFDNFKKFVMLGYDELEKTTKENFDFDLILEILKTDFFDCKVQILNGDSQDSNLTYNNFKYIIAVGGIMVERGLTVKNLAVTYIVRTNKGKENADTVLQRSRWFGYKISKGISYLDVCRVFMTEQMAERCYDLKLNEDSIWEIIKYQKEKGERLKSFKIIFELANTFNPTRKSVLPYYDDLKFGKWITQRSVKGFNKNYDALKTIDDFLSNYDYKDVTYIDSVFRLYKDVDLEKMYTEIIERYYLNSDLKFDYNYVKGVIEKLKIEKKPLTTDLLLMRYGKGEERKFINDFDLGNIMQGRNDQEGSKSYYPGDDNMHNGRVQLQVHYVYSKDNKQIIYPVLAFYAPESMGRLVGRLYD